MAFNINPGKQQFSATAAQTVFTFNFAIFSDTDLKVYKTLAGAVADDTADLLTLSTHYTVSINGTLGGTVTLLSGASLNDTLTVVRSLPIARTTDYVTNGDLYAEILDLDQDYQTYLVLDQKQRWERSVVFPDTYSGSQIDFPVPEQYKLMRWNLTADGLENIDPSTVLSASDAAIIESVTDFTTIDTSVYTTAIVKDLDRGGTFIWSATGTANDGTVFAGATGFWNRQYSGAVNVKWFGAVGDGITDDTTAVQNFLNMAGDLHIPYGTYKFVSTLVVRSNTSLYGNRSLLSYEPLVGTYNYEGLLLLNITNVLIDGIKLDGNNNFGVNGIGISNSGYINIVNSEINKFKLKIDNPYQGGGSGITCQFDVNNVIINNCVSHACSYGFNINGSIARPVKQVEVANCIFDTCEFAISIFDTADEFIDITGNHGVTECNISNITCKECGIADVSHIVSGGTGGTDDGGVIWLHNAINVNISNVQSSCSTKIGGVVRGSCKQSSFTNITHNGTLIAPIMLSRPFNIKPWISLSKTVTITGSEFNNIRCTASPDYAVFNTDYSNNRTANYCKFDITLPQPAIRLVLSLVASSTNYYKLSQFLGLSYLEGNGYRFLSKHLAFSGVGKASICTVRPSSYSTVSTLIPLTTVVANNGYTLGTDHFIIPEDGFYEVSGYLSSTSGLSIRAHIRNGITPIDNTLGSNNLLTAGQPNIVINAVFEATKNDQIGVYLYDGAVSLNYSYISIKRLSD